MARVPAKFVTQTSQQLLSPQLAVVPHTSLRRLSVKGSNVANALQPATAGLRTPSISNRFNSSSERSFSTSNSHFSPKVPGATNSSETSAAETKTSESKLIQQAQIHAIESEAKSIGAGIKASVEKGDVKLEDAVNTLLEKVENLNNKLETLTNANEQEKKNAESDAKGSKIAQTMIIAGVAIAVLQDLISVADSVNDVAMTYNKEWCDKVLDTAKKYLPEKVDPEENQWDVMEPITANKAAIKNAVGHTGRTLILLGIAVAASRSGNSQVLTSALNQIRNAFIRFK